MTYKLLLLIALLLPTPGFASKAVFKFSNIGSEQGLSNPFVSKVLQDAQGYIWVATQSGLYRYDGHTFKAFKHDPQDPTSLPGNYIQTLYNDKNGVLWVGIWHGGMAQYHPGTDTFTNYQHEQNNPNSLSSNEVMAIVGDANDNLWVATLNGGLERFNKNDKTFSHYRHDPKDPNSLSSDSVFALLHDSQGFLWVGTSSHGLNRLDTKAIATSNNNKSTAKFKQFTHNPSNADGISHNKIHTLIEDQDATVWIGTKGGGLNRFNRQTSTFSHFRHNPNDTNSLATDQVWAIHQGTSGSLWIGALKGGLTRFEIKTNRFTRYNHNPQDKDSLSDDDVFSITQDQTGLIWLGTFGGGISHFDSTSERFGFKHHDANDPHSLTKGDIHAIFKDSSGVLWVGTESGLNRLDPITAQFKHYRHYPSNPNSLSDSDVWAIFEDSQKQLWIGTRKGGLNLFNRQQQKFVHYQHASDDINSLTKGYTQVIHEDSQRNLWIGTAGGLSRFNPKTNNFTRYLSSTEANSISHNLIYALYTAQDGTLMIGTNGGGLDIYNHQTQTFTNYKNDPTNPNSLSHNTVYSIYQDAHGIFWLGTTGGLNRFNLQQKTFKHYREKDGLPSDRVSAVLGDNNGNLWLGNDTISRFNPKSGTFTNNIGINAGCLKGAQGAYFKATDTKLYFGNCAFYPEQAIRTGVAPALVFTDFRLLNQSVSLAKTINHTESITLSHLDNVLSFEFSALHYADVRANQYQYKLDGFNLDWIATSADNRRATFTNLAAGQYTFRVKASNNAEVWHEQGRAIKLTITPAPWRTWWAYSIYVFLSALIVGTLLQQRRQKLQALILAKNHAELARINAEQASKNAELAKQHAEKASQSKTLFVADVSHEIRTPLNAVLGYAQMLQRDSTLSTPQRQKIDIIDRSGNHLLTLINNILDIAKIEANAMALVPEDYHLLGLVADIRAMLINNCDKKGLSWYFDDRCGHQSNEIAVHGDPVKLRQVLINLLGNAIKFTPKGAVTLKLSCVSTDHYCFEVTDTGGGIAPEQQQMIFESFGQTIEGAEHGGTGLGLAIANKQVALMGGKLELDSTPGKGSRFYFTLPLPPAKAPVAACDDNPVQSLKLAPGVKVTAMVADDNEQNRTLLVQILQEAGLQVLEATNGENALNKLKQVDPLPQLVFMNPKMPLMNGEQVVKMMHQTFEGPIPPCIAVTANAMQRASELYLSQGFDHYIAKPYRLEAIYSCIDLLLDVKFETLFGAESQPELAIDSVTSTEEQPIEPETVEAPKTALNLTSLTIPQPLYQSLINAATNYEVTELEALLPKLHEQGKQGQQLSEHLNQYLTNYDIDGLLEELEKVK